MFIEGQAVAASGFLLLGVLKGGKKLKKLIKLRESNERLTLSISFFNVQQLRKRHI